MSYPTLEGLVEQHGTNLLIATLLPGTVIRFVFYGRLCQIKVTDVCAEFSVDE